jgi:hypothetical protein
MDALLCRCAVLWPERNSLFAILPADMRRLIAEWIALPIPTAPPLTLKRFKHSQWCWQCGQRSCYLDEMVINAYCDCGYHWGMTVCARCGRAPHDADEFYDCPDVSRTKVARVDRAVVCGDCVEAQHKAGGTGVIFPTKCWFARNGQ